MIAVTGEAAAVWVTLRTASGASARERTATRIERVRSGVAVAGVNRKPPLTRVPRRASAAARRGSETAGVKASIGRPLAEARALRSPPGWAMAGASSSAIATSDALPAAAMARNLLKNRDSNPPRFNTTPGPFP